VRQPLWPQIYLTGNGFARPPFTESCDRPAVRANRSVGRALRMVALHDQLSEQPPTASPPTPLVGEWQQTDQPDIRSANPFQRSDVWGRLMTAAQRGEEQAYRRLLRELDAWLRRYYARRLPGPAADDARQDALLAIHTKRFSYEPSRPFGRWVAAIARYKWIDHIRAQSRSSALSLNDDIPVADHGEAATSAVAIDDFLRRLKPAQADVIRLVKLQGGSIDDASKATGQSKALVKVNIHRGLKKLTALAAGGADCPSLASIHAELAEVKQPAGRGSAAP
jgi:RNA polymerase sigma factor (sigma-70 family)